MSLSSTFALTSTTCKKKNAARDPAKVSSVQCNQQGQRSPCLLKAQPMNPADDYLDSVEEITQQPANLPDVPAWVLRECTYLNRCFVEKMGDSDA